MLTLLMSMVASVASASDFEVDGIYYNITSEEGLTVEVTSGSSRYTGSVTIPASVTYNEKSYSVTSIGNNAFRTCTDLTSVTIPESVTSIGNNAFFWCFVLASINIPESVTSIGNGAFDYCESLTSITIPKGVTSIGSDVFSKCSGLTSITIPSSVTSIGSNAFSSCTSLPSVTIPEGVTSIGRSAFEYCTSLTSVTIPGSVKSIEYNVFSNCTGLTSITLSEGVTTITSYAFLDCKNLASITIPSTVTSIDNYAFRGCSGRNSVTVAEGNPTYNSQNNCNAIIKTSNNTLILGCKNTIIPESVTSIGDYAFRDCSVLTSITIPESVTSIGNGAFYYCSGLTSITFPEGVTSIGSEAFYGCSGLTSIHIPESVTSIRSGAFSSCIGLTSITVEDGNSKYDCRNNCNAIIQTANNTLIAACNNTVIPMDVTSIGSAAFSGCSGLTSITIPDGVTSIGVGAFRGCSGLTSITIPENVTSIERNAFWGCSGLTSITIPEGVTSIEDYVFYECSGLTSVTIPEGVTSIGDCAFRGCSSLTSITIPENVTSIGTWAFYQCDNLTSVTALRKTPVAITSSSVFSNRANATLHVPYGCKSAYEAADYWKEFKSIVELDPTELEISVGSTGMATYCSEFDLDFTGSDAKAYIVSAFTPSTAQVILTHIYDVKAGTGIIVKAAEGNYTIPIREAETIVSNMLRGVTEPTILNKVDGDYTNYILAKKNDVLGFYAVTDGSTLGANKAYLPLLTSALPSAEVKLMMVFDDEMYTGIETPEKQEASEGDIYNLNGQRMSRLQKGLNIVGGKKVFIK